MPHCPACGAEVEAEGRCPNCSLNRAVNAAPTEVDDETLILRLLEAPAGRIPGQRVGRIWLLDPSGGEVEQAPELLDEITFIGRSHDCQLVLPSNTVSRRHAQIRRAGDRFQLSDLGSTNGTLLNAEPVIGEETLKDRDEIGIGIYRLIFRYT